MIREHVTHVTYAVSGCDSHLMERGDNLPVRVLRVSGEFDCFVAGLDSGLGKQQQRDGQCYGACKSRAVGQIRDADGANARREQGDGIAPRKRPSTRIVA